MHPSLTLPTSLQLGSERHYDSTNRAQYEHSRVRSTGTSRRTCITHGTTAYKTEHPHMTGEVQYSGAAQSCRLRCWTMRGAWGCCACLAALLRTPPAWVRHTSAGVPMSHYRRASRGAGVPHISHALHAQQRQQKTAMGKQ